MAVVEEVAREPPPAEAEDVQEGEIVTDQKAVAAAALGVWGARLETLREEILIAGGSMEYHVMDDDGHVVLGYPAGQDVMEAVEGLVSDRKTVVALITRLGSLRNQILKASEHILRAEQLAQAADMVERTVDVMPKDELEFCLRVLWQVHAAMEGKA